MVNKKLYICTTQNERAVSSVGSEHLVYTQRVGGSNPSPPTDRVLSSVGSEHLVYTQRVRGSNPLEPTKV